MPYALQMPSLLLAKASAEGAGYVDAVRAAIRVGG